MRSKVVPAVVVVVVVLVLTLITSADNRCTVLVEKVITRNVSKLTTSLERVLGCCRLQIVNVNGQEITKCLSTCNLYTTQIRYTVEYYSKNETIQVSEEQCCAGYDDTDGLCVQCSHNHQEPTDFFVSCFKNTLSHCENGCQKGICVSPSKCVCTPGYTGKSCETEIQKRCPQSCGGVGTCLADGVCDCTGTKYKGPYCEDLKCELDNQPCQRPCSYNTEGVCLCDDCYQPINGTCMHSYKCLIGGQCYNSGEVSSNNCKKCVPSEDKFGWMYLSLYRTCDDGNLCTKTDRCDGMGECFGEVYTCDKYCEYCNGHTCSLNTSCLTTTKIVSSTTIKPTTLLQTASVIPTDIVLSCGKPFPNKLHWPHPINCNQFYYCVNGYPVLKMCPAGTLYEDTIQVCVHPRDHKGLGCSQN